MKSVCKMLPAITILLIAGWISPAACWTEQQILHPPDQHVTGRFGRSIALLDDTLIVGASRHNKISGNSTPETEAVHVFHRSGFIWRLVARLTASDAQPGDEFGFSVAISKDTVAVGSPKKSSNRPGAVYLFVKPSTGWSDSTETAILTASRREGADSFGESVAIAGDTVVVGAPGSGIGGAAFVFTKPATGWCNSTENAGLTASDGQAGDLFGGSVAIFDDTVVVGAAGEDGGPDDPLADSGAVYIFTRPDSGFRQDRTEDAKLSASDAQDYDEFGSDVAIFDNTVVVGAPYERGGAGDPFINTGAVYVFSKPASGWKSGGEDARLSVADPAAYSEFGHSVALAGNTVIVGAPHQRSGPDNQLLDTGAVYIFHKPANGWKNRTEDGELSASDARSGGNFGQSVAVSGNTIAVGACPENEGEPPLQGRTAVYLYDQTSDARASRSLEGPRFLKGPYISCVKNVAAVVQLQTDKPVSCRVDYGIGAPRGRHISFSEIATNHSIRLADLRPDSTYQFRITIRDQSGKTTTSKILHFTTSAKPDITFPIITRGPLIKRLTDTSVLVEWQTNEPAASEVDYGIDTSLDHHITNKTSFTTLHRVQLTGLESDRKYFLRVSNVDSVNNGPMRSKIIPFSTSIAKTPPGPAPKTAPSDKATRDLLIQLAKTETTIADLQKKLFVAKQTQQEKAAIQQELILVKSANRLLRQKLLNAQKALEKKLDDDIMLNRHLQEAIQMIK